MTCWRARLGAALLFGFPVLWIGASHIGPLLVMARISVLDAYPPMPGVVARPSFASYAALLDMPLYAKALMRSVLLAAATSLLALIVCYPLAHHIAFYVRPRARWRRLALFVAPFWASEIVRAFALMLVLGRRGAVNAALVFIVPDYEPAGLLYGPASLALGLLYAVLPTMLLPLYATLSALPPDLREAAAGLGAGPGHRLARIVWPLARRGIVAALALVFLSTLGLYAMPLLLGPPDMALLPSLIADLFGSGAGRWPQAAAASVVLLLTGLAAAGGFVWLAAPKAAYAS